jgi:hypothetical protein
MLYPEARQKKHTHCSQAKNRIIMKKSFPIPFSKTYRINSAIDDFLKTFYLQQLTYMASDLLDNEYEPKDIMEGLDRAMTVCKTAGLPVACHFMPLYSDRNGVTIRDCKLSLLGYQLLLLNANPNHPATARFQLNILERLGTTAKPRPKNYDRHL